MRLIDADELEKRMSDTVMGDIRDYPYDDATWDTAFRWLDSCQTIEAEPVKHGRWERIDPNDHNDFRYECSNCKSQWIMEDEKDEYSYCSICGAKMDEVEE